MILRSELKSFLSRLYLSFTSRLQQYPLYTVYRHRRYLARSSAALAILLLQMVPVRKRKRHGCPILFAAFPASQFSGNAEHEAGLPNAVQIGRCGHGGRRHRRDTFMCSASDPVEGYGVNAAVPQTLSLGNIVVPPVVLAPMAGVTNYPFRRMCADYGAGLFVSEMLLAKNVADGKYEGKARFGPQESPRSAQLYGTSPTVMRAAAERLILEQKVDHIDLNFGCPARKVLRKGGGAAIPADPVKLRKIVSAVTDVAAPLNVPVTAKMRLGLDWFSLNYLEAGHIIEDCGAAAVTLHARTAKDGYDEGAARRSWPHIAGLAAELSIPVLANGDIFTAADALKVVRLTGAAGVVIGRGCLGRPWLFRDLADAFRLKWAAETTVPDFRIVADTMMSHLETCVAWQALDGVSEEAAVSSMRKWFGWYWRGYNGFPSLWVPRMCKQSTVAGVRQILWEADPDNISYNYNIVVGDRGKRKKEKMSAATFWVPPDSSGGPSMAGPDADSSAERHPLMPRVWKGPKMPSPPPKSASQRKPKTEKGKRQLARREAAREAVFQAKREKVLEWRRERAEPRRRAHAVNVKKERAKRGVKTGTRPESFLPPRKSRPPAVTDNGKASSGERPFIKDVEEEADEAVDGG